MIRSVYLIARRDYLGYVTAWGFWLGLLLTPVLLGAGMSAPLLAASSQPVRHFAVLDATGAYTQAVDAVMAERRRSMARDLIEAGQLMGEDGGETLARFEAALETGADPDAALKLATGDSVLSLPPPDFERVTPPADTLEALRPWLLGERLLEGQGGSQAPLFAVLRVTDTGVEYWSENVTVTGLKSLARRAAERLARQEVFADAGVSLALLDEVESRTPELIEQRVREDAGADAQVTLADRAPFIASVAVAFFLWTLVFSVVNYLLMGTIEERSNKIFDTLLTSVRLPDLLAGKLIAVLAVSLTLMLAWSAFGGLIALAVGNALSPEAMETVSTLVSAALAPGLMLPALASFLFGYLIYGTVFLALGSLCDTIQEAQTLMSPLLILLMVPLFMLIVAIGDPTSPILSFMSWIPLFTPFLLILRVPTDPPVWEVLAQLALMAGTAFVMLAVSARVYRAGAVHGASVNDALQWMRHLGRGPAA